MLDAMEEEVFVLLGNGGRVSSVDVPVFVLRGRGGGVSFVSEAPLWLRAGKFALARRGMTGSGRGETCGTATWLDDDVSTDFSLC